MIWLKQIDPKGNTIIDTIKGISKDTLKKEREFTSENGSLILATDDRDLISSSRLFSKTGNLAINIFDETNKYFRTQLEAQSHTLKNIQAHLTQKIEQIIDSPLRSNNFNYEEKSEILKQKILNDPDKATEVLLYLNKRIFELDAHMSSFQLIYMGEFIDLVSQQHNIRRLILNIWHVFDDEFNEKKLHISLNFLTKKRI